MRKPLPIDFSKRRVQVYFQSVQEKTEFLAAARQAAIDCGLDNFGNVSWFMRRIYREWQERQGE